MSIIPRRSTGPRLWGSSGNPDTTTYSTVNSRPLQTSSPKSSRKQTASLDYSPAAAQRVNRSRLLTRQSRAAQPQMEPGPAGKCRNRPHQMNMSITTRKTIKTISDDISCERTQKKRKLNALLVDQRRQEKVSRSNGKPREATASHVGDHQDLRHPSPSLIDPSSLSKLPHLYDQQKAHHSQLSQNMTKGIRTFQQNQHQPATDAAQQSQPQQGQPVQLTQSNNPQNFTQLLPQIQAKVSALNFYLPPNITQKQLENWIPEARLRYGIALQKQEVGRARIADLRQQFTLRQGQGNITQDEKQEFKDRQLLAEKLFREGGEFLTLFKEQQERFKAQAQAAVAPNAMPGLGVVKKNVSPHRSVSAHEANRFTADIHKLNKFGDYDTQQLLDLPASSSEGFRGTKGADGISRAFHDASQNRDSRPSLFEFDTVEIEHSERDQHKCSYPNCGRYFRDIKAHMLTHQTERPEKCPIETCEYHIKGFARKYDKNRHTLTHFKGTLVCGFCPGASSAAEKSFGRADVFKRHLTSVHGVEQISYNPKHKITGPAGITNRPSVIVGKCSICTRRFGSAQSFYNHLDDCVLEKVLQQQYSKVGGLMENDMRSTKYRYICTLPNCGKTFAQKTHFEIHTRAHSGTDYYTARREFEG